MTGRGSAMKRTDPKRAGPGACRRPLRERWPQLVFASFCTGIVRLRHQRRHAPELPRSGLPARGGLGRGLLRCDRDPPAAVFEKTAPTSSTIRKEAPENAKNQGVRSLWSGGVLDRTARRPDGAGRLLPRHAGLLPDLPARTRANRADQDAGADGWRRHLRAGSGQCAQTSTSPTACCRTWFACPGRCADRSLRCVNVPYPSISCVAVPRAGHTSTVAICRRNREALAQVLIAALGAGAPAQYRRDRRAVRR